MYKTITVPLDTYKKLNALADRLKKPKSTLIGELVNYYNTFIENKEKLKTKSFSQVMDTYSSGIKLPKNTKIYQKDLISGFDILDDSSF